MVQRTEQRSRNNGPEKQNKEVETMVQKQNKEVETMVQRNRTKK